MNILSFQSSVAYGHVGNRAAVFPLETLGHTVWPIDTVSFSNHPAFGEWRGRVNDAQSIAGIVDGLAALGAFERCDAVLSGYLGAAATGPVVLDAVARIKDANPKALFVLDPVMGDDEKGLYVDDAIPAFFHDEAVPLADIVLPNRFELSQLAGTRIATVDDAAGALQTVRLAGPERALVTGVRVPEGVATLLAEKGQTLAVTTPWIETPSYGAGDAFGALFLGHFLSQADSRLALEHAVSAIYGILVATEMSGGEDLALVEARAEITAPSEKFAADTLAKW